VDELFEILVVEVVDFYLLEEGHEGLLEVVPALLDVDEGLCYQDQFVLGDWLHRVVTQLAVHEGEVHFLAGVLPLRNGALE
jgi:hypothetical protein